MSSSIPAERVMALTTEVRTFVLLSNTLRALGCKVTRASALSPAIQILRGTPHDLLFLDLTGDCEQVNWVPHLLAENYSLRIVAVVAHGCLGNAIRCLRAGAQDCLEKPIDPSCLRRLVSQASGSSVGGTAVSAASCMRLAMDNIRRAAQCDFPVMLRGEHGTGKTRLAEELHRQSGREKFPFVTVNCPSLSAELATSELFGHRKGSFTGAVADQLGKVETAEGGSLFLDELGDLPTTVQARLLRFLQDRAFERLGENMTRYANVRLITATNRNLESLIDNGMFRPDLFYRLSGIEITIPPLRERRGDIVAMAKNFLRSHCETHGRRVEFAPETIDLLTAYDWPGNVRELNNEIQRAVVMTSGSQVRPDDLSPRLCGLSSNKVYLGGSFTLQQVADHHVTKLLMRYPRVGKVAHILDIERSTLLSRRRRLGLRKARSAGAGSGEVNDVE